MKKISAPEIVLVIVGCLLLVTIIPTFARAQDQTASQGGDSPINISADQMEADDRAKVITFTGNVVVRQNDVVLNCDLMRAYYRETSSLIPPKKTARTHPLWI